jgi:cAMP-binding proteins - catabolite gene activator and regulatory subunit of cAMP-dependent protein kinases
LKGTKAKEEESEMKQFYRSAGRRLDDAVAIRTKRANIMKSRAKEQGRRAGLLGGFELFLGLTEEESRKVTRRMEEIRFLRGETIFRKDDPSDSLFALKEGLVKLVAHPEKGAGTILYILRPTDIFGELLIVEERRPFNALAVTDVLVGVLSKDDFIRLLSAISRIRLNFIRILSRRLALVQKGAVEFSHTRSYQRLAKVLLRICVEHGEEIPGGVMLRPLLTHTDLAEMIGATRETVTTQMIRFRRMGLVKRQDRFLVVNKPRLEEFGSS